MRGFYRIRLQCHNMWLITNMITINCSHESEFIDFFELPDHFVGKDKIV
jgi:hypothetical protein